MLTDGIRAVVFDKDGVLNKLELMRQAAFLEVAHQMGYAACKEQDFHCVLGLTKEESMAALRERPVFGKEFPAEVVRARRDILLKRIIEEDGVPVREGAKELLETLKGEKFLIGLATSDFKENAIRELQRNGLLDFFDTIISGETPGIRSKPAPDVFLKACEELKIPARAAFGIEDSEAGARAVSSAEMRLIHVEDIKPPSDFIKGKAEFLAKTLGDVGRYIMGVVRGASSPLSTVPWSEEGQGSRL